MLEEGRSLTQPSGAFNRSSPCEPGAEACGAFFEAIVGGDPHAQQKAPVSSARLILMVMQDIVTSH